MQGPQVQSPRSSRGRSARRDMRSAGRSGQAERGRVKGEAHVRAERKGREAARAHEHERSRKSRRVSERSAAEALQGFIYSDKSKLFLNRQRALNRTHSIIPLSGRDCEVSLTRPPPLTLPLMSPTESCHSELLLSPMHASLNRLDWFIRAHNLGNAPLI